MQLPRRAADATRADGNDTAAAFTDRHPIHHATEIHSERSFATAHDSRPTSRRARAASFRPEVMIADGPTRVVAEQVGAVDAQRLGRRVGRLTADEMWAVDEALATVLGLD